jgi:hypothetical protein
LIRLRQNSSLDFEKPCFISLFSVSASAASLDGFGVSCCSHLFSPDRGCPRKQLVLTPIALKVYDSVLLDFLWSLGHFHFLKMPDNMPQYYYSPLSQKPNVIRLLLLLPSKDEPENLRGELFEYTIRESDRTNHPYEALSYVWGDSHKPQSIIIDNQKLAITQNLYTGLLHLRDHELPRIVWVDAICIDQANKKEKGHQIQIMAAIYAKASRVIVWLGEAQDDSDRALELIRDACEKSAVPSNIELFKQAVLKLLKRPWFHRVWVRNQNCIMSVGVTKCCSRSCKK